MKKIFTLFFVFIQVSIYSQIIQDINKTSGTVSTPINNIDSIRFNNSTGQMEVVPKTGVVEKHNYTDINNVSFSGQLVGTITSLSCGSVYTNGTLNSGTPVIYVSTFVNYSGGNGGSYSGQVINSTGVIGLTATLTSSTFVDGSGTLIFTISGTPTSNGIASFLLNIGGQTCTFTIFVDMPIGIVDALLCNQIQTNGYLYEGKSANNVSVMVPYSGGNGGIQKSVNISSLGVSGLTANIFSTNLYPNSFVGIGIFGTPSNSGTANFYVTIGGKTCLIKMEVYPACLSSQTVVVDVTNPITGDIWMDRNLGASQVATSITDVKAYGDFYQWGRLRDGHQCRTSSIENVLSSSDVPGHGNFIRNGSGNIDWRSATNNNLWQGSNGINNPCPTGYRVPTEAEINLEVSSWSAYNSTGAYSSPLKFTLVGFRDTSGFIRSTDMYGFYWSSTISAINAKAFFFNDFNSFNINQAFVADERANGYSVRCIKEQTITGTIGSITGVTHSGTLTKGLVASGVSSVISYSGGNGGTYTDRVIPSKGVNGLTATLTAGSFTNGSGSLTYTITGTPTSSGTASFYIYIGGQTYTLTRTVLLPVGILTSLDCSNATNYGVLDFGVLASGVSSSILYSSSNGGYYSSQSIASTGVTGLTATLNANNFSNGSSYITYFITGTPTSGGVASFAINLGGQSCTLTRTVNIGTITLLDCSSVSNNGVLTIGVSASGVNSIIPYSGGNGKKYQSQVVSSTGVTGLTATLTSGTFNNGSGTLIYTITGTPSNTGTANFALNIGGQTCILTRTVNLPVGTITALNCGSEIENGTLYNGESANGVSSIIPYTGGNGGTYSSQIINSTGVIGLTATLSAGTFLNGNGNLNFIINGTANTSGYATFKILIDGKSCSFDRYVILKGLVANLDCNSTTNSSVLNQGSAVVSETSSIPYTGGNGGVYSSQILYSTGVTGLTARLSAGNFTSSNGNLIYTITGTPSSSGLANFTIDIGGKSCVLSRIVNAPLLTIGSYQSTAVHCNGTPTLVVDVTNPITGKTWMDRNLGASQAAVSYADPNSLGDLYQWGRATDGHQCRNSAKSNSRTSTDLSNQNFIYGYSDWQETPNNNLWQGVNGVNNPCPYGYRIPTEAEFIAEYSTWSSLDYLGGISSPLKFTSGTWRDYQNGNIINYTINGLYWSSTLGNINNNIPALMYFGSSSAGISTGGNSNKKANGLSVRCIKD